MTAASRRRDQALRDYLFWFGSAWEYSPESRFLEIGNYLPQYLENHWEIVEIAGLYDNAIIIEYLGGGCSR